MPTLAASVRNSSAVHVVTGTIEKRMTTNTSPGGSTPPKPKTDLTAYGTTNSAWSGTLGEPRASST